MKPRAVIFSPEAAVDLQWIYEIVASAAGPVTALNYIERIERYCDRLDMGSERGTLRNDIRPGLRIVGFERRITLAFTVAADRVEILRVFYGGADWEGNL